MNKKAELAELLSSLRPMGAALKTSVREKVFTMPTSATNLSDVVKESFVSGFCEGVDAILGAVGRLVEKL